MRRVLVVWCPELVEEHENGRAGRIFGRVVEAVGVFTPAVEVVRPGVCAVGTRGPSRYFGGDEALARLVAEAVGSVEGITAGVRAGVGVADGLFAAAVAARGSGTEAAVVAPGGTPGFLAPWPVAVLDRPELEELLERLGIGTLGGFAALPAADVLARFGTDGAVCHRVAQGREGELPGLRLAPRRGGEEAGPPTRQPQFWGGEAGAGARAGRAVARVGELIGPEAVVVGRLQGGRGPAERARLVPWPGGRRTTAGRGAGPGADPPWPGRVPPPAPVTVMLPGRAAALVDGDDRTVVVGGGGLLSADPARLSVEGGPWVEVTGWAGPWPSDERWWSARRRQARMQVVTDAGQAHLLTRERGRWWLEGTYD